MSEQGMLYQAANIIEEKSLGVKELVKRFIASHSDQDRYDVIKQIIAINTAGNSIIEQLNRYGFSVLETERVLAISDIDTQGITAVKRGK